MHGNVGQWCLDYRDGYNSDPAIDYLGAESGSARVFRGYGGYNDIANSYYRFGVAPSNYGSQAAMYTTYLGFRLSWTLAE